MVREPKQSPWWRLEHQWWFVLIVLPFGWLAWAAFAYLGFRLRRWAWTGAAAVYLALTTVAWVLFSLKSNDDDWKVGVFAGISFTVWIASFVHALIIRREALDRLSLDEDPRLRAARSRIVTRDAAEDVARERPGLALEAGIGQDADTFGGLVDVNHASAAEFAELPGFTPELATNVVKVRDQVDGFDSVLDFATVLDLPPRLLDSLRDRLICLPR